MRCSGIATELVGLLEFVAQGGCAQVFADVGEALLEGEQGALDGHGVGEGNVAPHGERAGAEARHFAQGAAADVLEFGGSADFLFQERAEGGGRELGQMADPGHHLVVTGGVDVDDARTHGGDESAPFGGELCAARGALPGGVVGEEPDRAAEEIGVGEFGAAALLAGHGMAGEKSGAVGRVVEACGRGYDLGLGAADVGDELIGGEDGASWTMRSRVG